MPRVDYDGLLQEVTQLVDQCKTAEAARQATVVPPAMIEQNVLQSPTANGNYSLESEELCFFVWSSHMRDFLPTIHLTAGT